LCLTRGGCHLKNNEIDAGSWSVVAAEIEGKLIGLFIISG